VVTELLALPGRNDAAAALLRSAVAGLAESGVAVATTWLPRRHPYASLFRDEAFVPVPRRRTGFVARAVRLRDRELRILDSARCPLHVTRGDADDI
jgi:hypothetical protein